MVEERTGAEMFSSSGDAAGMQHKPQVVATEIGQASHKMLTRAASFGSAGVECW